jgi:transcriptional regulator with XRE-family HTH domain
MSRGYLKNLKKLRRQKGWSQEKLAREAGISYQTLIKIEQGRIKNPKLETLIKLTKALHVSLNDLIK